MVPFTSKAQLLLLTWLAVGHFEYGLVDEKRAIVDRSPGFAMILNSGLNNHNFLNIMFSVNTVGQVPPVSHSTWLLHPEKIGDWIPQYCQSGDGRAQ